MERIVIRHLSGSKAGEEVGFPLDQLAEISFGRDANSTIAYDAQHDDAVSRTHARIERDPSKRGSCILIDAGSRNGVFVNGARIAGRHALHHGDVVQLGAGGPEFMFQWDPPPADVAPPTRQIDLAQTVPAPTREIRADDKEQPAARQRIVIRHLSGSKANQEITFLADEVKQISFGRDPASTVPYDAERDDAVSRAHARLECDPRQKTFVLTDLNSRNGVFVNAKRISGGVALRHGDVVRLGEGGPEFAFQLDPPPADAMGATRQFDPPRREPAAMATREAAAAAPPPSATASGPRPVGKETVERLITQSKSESKKHLVNGVAAVLAVVAIVAGVLLFKGRETEQKVEVATSRMAQADSQVTETREALKKTASDVEQMKKVKTPREIAEEYAGSTVYIEVSWKLIDLTSGQPLYHLRLKGRPVYVRLPNGNVEPLLTSKPQPGVQPIGGEHSGSGFAVTDHGFILTNKHVAAPWKTRYTLEPGVLFGQDAKGEWKVVGEVSKELAWIPEHSSWFTSTTRVGEPKPVAGRNDRLDVTFANNKLRTPGKLVLVSQEHDVALIKIDTPTNVKPAVLAPDGSYDEVKAGDAITVLGYPGVSPKVYVAARSKDMLDPGRIDFVSVPVPTITPGNIGKVIRGSKEVAGDAKMDYYSASDSYQLTANATGPGNSGGPVFDDQGRVIGILHAQSGQAMVTYAVPIKFASELIDVKSVLK